MLVPNLCTRTRQTNTDEIQLCFFSSNVTHYNYLYSVIKLITKLVNNKVTCTCYSSTVVLKGNMSKPCVFTATDAPLF